MLLAPATAAAFDTHEHVWISNRAACIAYLAASDLVTDAEDLRRVQCALRSLLEESPGGTEPRCEPGERRHRGEKKVTYGDIAAYGDFVPRPHAAIDTTANGRRRIDDDEINDRSAFLFDMLAEIALNPQHFRRAALAEFHAWHEHAVGIARRRDRDALYDALAYNAYGDHFLQDFFAPGHMTEDEQGKSQIETNRVHDRDNGIGRTFAVNVTFITRLKHDVPHIDDHLTSCLGGVAVEDTGPPCAGDHEVGSQARWSIANLLPAHEATQPVTLELFGDKHLVHEECRQGLVHSKDQTILMALVGARSILDVVQTYASNGPADARRSSGPINHFPRRECTQPPTEDGCFYVCGDTAGIAAGHYRSRALSLPNRLRPFPMIAFTVDTDRINESSRKSFRLEPVFTITPPISGRRDHFTLEVAPAYTYVRGNDYDAHGPDGSLYLRIKRLHFFLSFDLGYRFFSGHGLRDERVVVGGRLGFGVGPLWSFVGFYNDASLDADGLDTDPLTFKFGVQFLGLPNLAWHYLRPTH